MENFGFMNITQWITTLGVFIGCFLYLLHRIDALESKSDAKFQAQSERSDRLYEIVIELLKERKKS